ncbi:MAG: hypothetical protein RI948_1329 [Bacteroidota bacterium]|jgi:hypothetical protein
MQLASEHPDLRRKYEQLVASETTFGFFAQTWVQDILHPNWEYVLNHNKEPIVRLPYTKKFGFKAYLQPLFLRSLPLLHGCSISELSLLKSKLFLHLNFNAQAAILEKDQIGKYQLLQWTDGIAAIRAGYSENVKRNLKKSKGLHLQPLNYAQFQEFFIAQKGEQLGNLNAAAWTRLAALYTAAQEKEQAFCVGVWNGSALLAVGLFFRFKEQLYFMKGTLNDEGKHVGALVFLLDAVLQNFADTCNALDFVGSNQESIAAFYRKFGAKDTYYWVLKGRWPFV